MTKREAFLKLLNGERVRGKGWGKGEFIYLDHEGKLVDNTGELGGDCWDLNNLNSEDWEIFSGPRICKFSELYDLLQPGDCATYADNNIQASLRLYEDGKREILIKCGGVIKSSVSKEELQATWTIHRGEVKA